MMRIDRMYHRHEDAVILLNSKVIVKGQTCALHPLISLMHVHVRGFILIYLFYYLGKAPAQQALICRVVDLCIFTSRLSSTQHVEHCCEHQDILMSFVCQLISGL
jgi:hypothetical protein